MYICTPFFFRSKTENCTTACVTHCRNARKENFNRSGITIGKKIETSKKKFNWFCSIQISPIRHINTVSPAESSACSPVRLKRYEGFEGGLNVMGRTQRNVHNLRTKSPPVKKSKRKETLENLGINFGPPSTPNEKKSSNESNPERFIFLGKNISGFPVFQLFHYSIIALRH